MFGSSRKVALVGHSGVGKSSCLRAANGTADGEMDIGLGTPISSPLEVAMKWITDNDEPMIVVSVHRELLKDLAHAKERGAHPKFFDMVLFVYLAISDNAKWEQRLRCQSAEKPRTESRIEEVLACFQEFDWLFRRLADRTIPTDQLDVAEVVAAVKKLQ
jgi:ATPase subunit of ABC transporter with duplicated ATPase domains